MTRVALLALVLPLALLAGCNDAAPDGASDPGTGAEAALPGPSTATASGDSVTGMPDEPGPNPSPGATPHSDLSADAAGPALLLMPEALPEAPTGALVPDMAADEERPPPVEPGAGDAAAVVRGYYAAIAAGNLDQAYALWADDGRASGQSPQQFASGFADVESVSVDVLQPGRVEPAAGSRYIEVPVAVTTVHRDGSRHRFVGAYTLRRSVVDGASDGQRAWRLHSADIREVQL